MSSVGIVTDTLTSEITETQFKDIERRQLDAVEWGKECFGIIRVPLFRTRAIQHHYYVVYLPDSWSIEWTPFHIVNVPLVQYFSQSHVDSRFKTDK